MALGLIHSTTLPRRSERFSSREPIAEEKRARDCSFSSGRGNLDMKAAKSLAALNSVSVTSIGGQLHDVYLQQTRFLQFESRRDRLFDQSFLGTCSQIRACSSRMLPVLTYPGKQVSDTASRKAERGQSCNSVKSKFLGNFGNVSCSKLPMGSILRRRVWCPVSDAMWGGDASRRIEALNFDYEHGRMRGVAKQLQAVLRREEKFPSTWDVVGLGQAMVDFSGTVDDDFLVMMGVEKGSRKVVNLEERGRVLKELDGKRYKLRAGGSLSNTLAALATLGAASHSLGAAPSLHVGMCGGVGGDPLGEFYRSKLLKTGVRFLSNPISDGTTGTVIVLTTPDAQRTMLAYQGNSSSVSMDDDSALQLAIGHTRVFMAEGYLLEVEEGTNAVRAACAAARAAGAIVAVTASDVSCVERHLSDFWRLIGGTADILFSNSDEARALAGLGPSASPSLAAAHLSHFTRLVSVTDGARGSYLACRGQVVYIHPPSCTPVDTCGAGDAYAAGLLYAILRGKGAEILLNGPPAAQAQVTATDGGGGYDPTTTITTDPSGDDAATVVRGGIDGVHRSASLVAVEEQYRGGELVLELLRDCGAVAAKVAATVVTQQGARLKNEDAVRLVQAFGAMPCMEGRWISGEGSKHPFGMGIGI